MLSILETQLGLIAPEVSPAKRLAQYHGCLSRLNTSNRFYHKSFEEDALAVTRTLMRWRDRWYEAGWQGTFNGKIGPRLNDMAEIEKKAQKEVAPCFGQRLQFAAEVLKKRKTQIELVELVDSFSDLPHSWQQVIGRLKYSQLEIDSRKPPAGQTTDLAKLQKALWDVNTKEGVKAQKIELKGDGSVVALMARSKAVSARLLAEHIKPFEPGSKVAVLVGGSGPEFDDALESVDAARCGFQNTHNRRPPLQALPLALNLMWEPLDPAALLQFLTHPVGPIPARIRRRLANAVSESPGIGGRKWQQAIEKIRAGEEEKRKASEKQIREMMETIDYWVSSLRHEPETGAPTKDVSGRCQRVAAWLAKMMGISEETPEYSLYAQAHRQATDLCEALDHLRSFGLERIDRNQLDRLIDQVAGSGGSLTDRFAEALHVPAADNPAVFCGKWDEIIWWNISMPELPRSYPWTKKELKVLQDNGVHLQPLDDRLNHLVATWLRPVMSANKRIVFVLHYSDEEQHPLWDQIKTCCTGWLEFDVEDMLQRGDRLPGFAARSQPLEPQPLPGLKRWWRLADGALLGARKKESFTSLDDFIKSPYMWVLKHKANLRTGNLAELPSGNRLKGTLVHRLFEDFFNEHKKWGQLKGDQATSWVDSRLPILFEQEGAVLLQPGRAADKEEFEELARRALIELIARLKAANARDIAMECYHMAPFFAGELGGYIDMLLTCKDGSDKVLDIKWGYANYKIVELRANGQLQLATYAYLRSKEAGGEAWPPQAYFIIDGAQLLTHDVKSFPGSFECRPDDGETTADLWRRFERSWRWRRKQLDRGLVEVTVGGTEPDDDSTPPDDGMAIEDVNDRFNDFAVLTGWGKDA